MSCDTNVIGDVEAILEAVEAVNALLGFVFAYAAVAAFRLVAVTAEDLKRAWESGFYYNVVHGFSSYGLSMCSSIVIYMIYV